MRLEPIALQVDKSGLPKVRTCKLSRHAPPALTKKLKKYLIQSVVHAAYYFLALFRVRNFRAIAEHIEGFRQLVKLGDSAEGKAHRILDFSFR